MKAALAGHQRTRDLEKKNKKGNFLAISPLDIGFELHPPHHLYDRFDPDPVNCGIKYGLLAPTNQNLWRRMNDPEVGSSNLPLLPYY